MLQLADKPLLCRYSIPAKFGSDQTMLQFPNDQSYRLPGRGRKQEAHVSFVCSICVWLNASVGPALASPMLTVSACRGFLTYSLSMGKLVGHTNFIFCCEVYMYPTESNG